MAQVIKSALSSAILKFFQKILIEIQKFFLYKKLGRQEAELKQANTEIKEAQLEVELNEEYAKIDAQDSSARSDDPRVVAERVRKHRDAQAGR